MMNRRKFLQTSVAPLIAGLPLWQACNAYASNLPAPALEHCEATKRAGALTFLLAAEAFPDPEHEQTDRPRIFDRRLHLNGLPQPDAVS